MTTQPEALRLADELEAFWGHYSGPEEPHEMNAAAELRRLHAENVATERQVEILTDTLAEASKANRELLEALMGMLALDEENHQRYPGDEDVCQEVQAARAAIAKVGEQK